MKRSNRNKKFSLGYRIEKWFYEDSVYCLIEGFRGICGMILCGLLLGSVIFLPALLH